jgi:ribosomal protein S18 acetylase RimI-like enzyme
MVAGAVVLRLPPRTQVCRGGALPATFCGKPICIAPPNTAERRSPIDGRRREDVFPSPSLFGRGTVPWHICHAAAAHICTPSPTPFMPQIHQLMIAEEELKALKAAALNMALDSPNSNERSACLAAMCEAADLGPSQNDEPKLVVEDGGIKRVLVGSLDLYAVRAMPGEVLIGASTNAAYLANVCTAPAARRRGVGGELVRAAREQARRWGVEDLYVHTMAVNEAALRFYEGLGFVTEKEESSNSAHHRGRCLDGIEGRGRTVLLKDMQL